MANNPRSEWMRQLEKKRRELFQAYVNEQFERGDEIMKGASGGVLRWSGSDGRSRMRLWALRWAVGGDAGGLVWRLRSWLAPTAPGGLGLTVRPYYEGLLIDRLDEGRTNGGESCRDQGERNAPCPVTEERCRGQKSPQVERREARRPASSAGDPWRSSDRPH